MQRRQDKVQNSDSNEEVVKHKLKVTIDNAMATRVPAWANANGDILPAGLQAKLTINQPGDVYEQEADRVAEQVMRMPADLEAQGMQVAASPGPAAIHRQAIQDQQPRQRAAGETGEAGEVEADEEAPEEIEESGESEGSEEEEAVQAKEMQGKTPVVTPQLQTQVDTMRGGGQALQASTRTFMEPRFGQDFSQVRVHTDPQASASAQAVGALAYTSGKDIAFAPNQYQPETTTGRQLLAHELTHVIQQENGDTAPLQRLVQRKINLRQGVGPDSTWKILTRRQAEKFVKRRFPKRQWRIVLLIVDEMFSSGDDFKFEDYNELNTEVFKRMRTSQLMEASQEGFSAFGAFGYPDKKLGPRVNAAAKKYWGPVQDEAGDYFFELSSDGRDDAYKAITSLFEHQRKKKNRTLIHCDYLASVIHMRVFAETIGAAEFNKRVKDGTIPLTLKWNGFQDIEDLPGHAPAQESLQEVRPSSEKDIIIGDHVIFWNHSAYDVINANIGNAWRLENAIVVNQSGGQLLFEGHGSGSVRRPGSDVDTRELTSRDLLHRLMYEFNKVVRMAKDLIHVHKFGQLHTDFPNVNPVGSQWRIQGDNDYKHVDVELKELTSVHDPDLIGLHDPADPSQMNFVKRPIESK